MTKQAHGKPVKISPGALFINPTNEWEAVPGDFRIGIDPENRRVRVPKKIHEVIVGNSPEQKTRLEDALLLLCRDKNATAQALGWSPLLVKKAVRILERTLDRCESEFKSANKADAPSLDI